MKCPHCTNMIHTNFDEIYLDTDIDGAWSLFKYICPSCKKYLFYFQMGRRGNKSNGGFTKAGVIEPIKKEFMAYPQFYSRTPLSSFVPERYAEDYKEASAVLNISPKASAALSRRCLQNILRDVAKVKPQNLIKEIEEILDSKQLPTYLSEGIDAVRNIGNFAAHPIKSTNTGEIISVESGEAEWLLDLLEGLFDFYFVQPKILEEKRKKLNEKLNEAGKPSLK